MLSFVFSKAKLNFSAVNLILLIYIFNKGFQVGKFFVALLSAAFLHNA